MARKGKNEVAAGQVTAISFTDMVAIPESKLTESKPGTVWKQIEHTNFTVETNSAELIIRIPLIADGKLATAKYSDGTPARFESKAGEQAVLAKSKGKFGDRVNVTFANGTQIPMNFNLQVSMLAKYFR